VTLLESSSRSLHPHWPLEPCRTRLLIFFWEVELQLDAILWLLRHTEPLDPGCGS